MKNGDVEFKKSLKRIERLAERLELSLPHVSDSLYVCIKLIRIYDKNIKTMLNLHMINKKTIDYMWKFLNDFEKQQVKEFVEELKNGKTNPA